MKKFWTRFNDGSMNNSRRCAGGSQDILEKGLLLINKKQPRWLMGWRDITNATNERTVIASVFPKVGTSDKLLLMHHTKNPGLASALLALLSSLTLDFVARQKGADPDNAKKLLSWEACGRVV